MLPYNRITVEYVDRGSSLVKKLTVMLDDNLYRAVKVEAVRHDQAVRELVTDALAEWLEILEDRELGALADEAMAEYEAKGGVPLEEVFPELKSQEKRRSA